MGQRRRLVATKDAQTEFRTEEFVLGMEQRERLVAIMDAIAMLEERMVLGLTLQP